MPYAQSRQYRIHFEAFGAGPPLVLQHGFSGTLNRWIRAGYIDALASRFRLIAVDALGHGESDKPTEPEAYRVEAQACDITAVLDAIEVDSAIYWGYSMGGRIAFALAKIAASRVSAFVIGGAHPYSRSLPSSDRADGSDPAAFVAALYRRTGMTLERLPQDVREELFANDFRALAAVQQDWPSLEGHLAEVAVPTLAYAGDQDTHFAKMREGALLIPHASFVPMPGLDHGTAFWDAQAVLAAVNPFLDGVSGGGRRGA